MGWEPDASHVGEELAAGVSALVLLNLIEAVIEGILRDPPPSVSWRDTLSRGEFLRSNSTRVAQGVEVLKRG
jgi:hypothetical protein